MSRRRAIPLVSIVAPKAALMAENADISSHRGASTSASFNNFSICSDELCRPQEPIGVVVRSDRQRHDLAKNGAGTWDIALHVDIG
jgi:hypothetical protein